MPSPEVLAAQGLKAVSENKYDEGIAKLSEALKERPAPLWLLERSKAYLRTKDFDLALYDAEKALRVAFDRANRDQMIEAQIRRSITYYRMGRYADADICAFWAIQLCEGAKATEDDGQHKKVDGKGNYTVNVAEVSAMNKPDKNDGIAAAMGGGRTKSKSLQNQAFTWRIQALTQLQNLDPNHDARKVKITAKYPTPSKEPPSKPVVRPTSSDVEMKDAAGLEGKRATEDAWETIWKQYRIMYGKKAIRTSFYQTDTTVNIDFFIKNVPKDEFKVDAKTDSVAMSPIPSSLPNTGYYSIELFLFDKIKPTETKYTVKSMKVELVLRKEAAGKWPTLRRENADIIDNIALGPNPSSGAALNQFLDFVNTAGYKDTGELKLPEFGSDQNGWYNSLLGQLRPGIGAPKASVSHESQSAQTAPVSKPELKAAPAEKPAAPASETTKAKPTISSAPGYPTSSKKGPTNWDNIDSDEEEEKKDGDANAFFQSLYANADPDTKRAMMKSYVESNGTSLSTSWAEAENKTYETSPPDGAEAKQWDKP
ncbi:SGS domain-containing protein [Xylariaceae sp. FL0016]|nr:SGS domain-containing protein [Xylariaceae sp. FL0016]